MNRRLLWASSLLMLVVGAAVLWPAIPPLRYGLVSDRINLKIRSLENRRPVDVSPRLWDFSVTWGSTAFCNVCFSESHAPYREMIRLERELDERLKQPVDLSVFEWLWTRLAATGPHGAKYVQRHKPDWDEQVRAALGTEEQPFHEP